MNYPRFIDLAYLPIREDSLDINIEELNYAYDFACRHKFRGFCTYPQYISFLSTNRYTAKLIPVVDFPNGEMSPEEKMFDVGRSYEICKRGYSSEVDVVLNPNTKVAIEDFWSLALGKINDKMNVKPIIGLGFRKQEEILGLLEEFHEFPDQLSYIKTNTGKEGTISFNDKLALVKWLRSKTELPLKVSGGVETKEQIDAYRKVAGTDLLFGMGFSKAITFVETIAND